ncbi:MAG: putative manganese transporter [Lachnospiraceae bacterium]|jgi:hypothetical protein
MEIVIHVLKHSCIETAKLLPFLFFTYLAMEYLEHKAGERTVAALQRSGKMGPLLGGILGVFPQCGFSAAASNLYAGRVITLGTLLAVYLSTSDEMLPILLSARVDAGLIGEILLVKILVGVAAGFFVDLCVKIGRFETGDRQHIHAMCQHAHCHCEERSIWYSAAVHSLQIAVFLLLVSVILNGIVECYGVENLMRGVFASPFGSVFLAGLVGLIPNCASSVAITQLYLEGVLSAGGMYAGLLSCAGVGVLVLFRSNHKMKENVTILAMLYGTSVLAGMLIEIFV